MSSFNSLQAIGGRRRADIQTYEDPYISYKGSVFYDTLLGQL